MMRITVFNDKTNNTYMVVFDEKKKRKRKINIQYFRNIPIFIKKKSQIEQSFRYQLKNIYI